MITVVVPGGWEFRWSWFFCFILFYAIWIFATTVLAARDPGPHERPTCAVAEIPHLEEPTFGLMLCFHCSEILDNSWTRHPSLSRALGPPLRSWSCQECTLSLQLPPGVCCSALTTAENRLLHSPSFRQQWKQDFHSLCPSSAGLLSLSLEGEREPQRTDCSSSHSSIASHSQGPVSFPGFPAPDGRIAALHTRVFPVPSEVPSLLAREKNPVFWASTINPSHCPGVPMYMYMFRFTYVLCL